MLLYISRLLLSLTISVNRNGCLCWGETVLHAKTFLFVAGIGLEANTSYNQHMVTNLPTTLQLQARWKGCIISDTCFLWKGLSTSGQGLSFFPMGNLMELFFTSVGECSLCAHCFLASWLVCVGFGIVGVSQQNPSSSSLTSYSFKWYISNNRYDKYEVLSRIYFSQ